MDAAAVSPCDFLAALLTAWHKQRNQTDTHDEESDVCTNQTVDGFICSAKASGCYCQTSKGSYADFPEQ